VIPFAMVRRDGAGAHILVRGELEVTRDIADRQP
jgi:hypothetical protein